MEQKIIKVEEVPAEKKEKFAVAKKIGKTILKIGAVIGAGIAAFYGYLLLNPDKMRKATITK